jgi:Hypothetical protein (DUF2513)
MKRDMELIRELLLAIEAQNSERPFYSALTLGIKASDEDIIYNLQLMIDADFLEAQLIKTAAGVKDIFIQRMTWNGSEFLDSTRNESIWNAAKETIIKKGLSLESVGFGALTQVVASAAKQMLDLN